MPNRTLRNLSLSAIVLAVAALPPTAGAAVALSPLFAGLFQAGTGLDARFAQIDSGWRGSTVLWDEKEEAYGSGVAIGSLDWGTGLWGRADWQAVHDAWAPSAPPGSAPVPTRTWAGLVGGVNFGNAVYNALYSDSWGPADLVPFFEGDAPPAHPGALTDNGWIAHYQSVQDNWTAHFTGLLRVTRPGTYDLSVLNDDGFFLRLTGGSQTLEIGRDFLNPRNRDGFAEALWLDAGLYGLELGMWNRLEAGVVDLRWSLDGGPWELVPAAHLLPSFDLARPLPAPSTLALALPALGLVLLARTGRRAVRRT